MTLKGSKHVGVVIFNCKLYTIILRTVCWYFLTNYYQLMHGQK